MDWAGWFMPRLRRREPLESLTPPAQDDLEQLAALREAGSRLTLPHPIRCFMAFTSDDQAREFMEQLDRESIRTQMRAEPDGTWTVTAVQTLIPTPGAITKVRETLGAMATAHGGRFVAWTAPPVY